MSEDIDEKQPSAKKYPSSDKPEHEAIDVLNYLLDERIKSHLDSRDKTPNHDGWLELINEKNEPMGRINVQVKKLPEKHTDNPKKQIKTKNLAYCFVSNDPFVLILVDVRDEVGYWAYISKQWYRTEKLTEQKSKIVYPGENKPITETDTEYINTWQSLIQHHDQSYFHLDKPQKGVINWEHRLNQNFEKLNTHVSEIASELDISGVGDYELIPMGTTDWHINLNKNFQQIENDLELLAQEINVDNIGGYNQPPEGKMDWHINLNYNFRKIEEDLNNIAKAVHDPS